MSDSVKFIFKVLLRVPIILLICYAILNVFGMVHTYSAVQGAQYTVENYLAENNYLTQDAFDGIVETLTGVMFRDNNGVLNRVSFVDDVGLVVLDGAGNPVEVSLVANRAGNVVNLRSAADFRAAVAAAGAADAESNICTRCQYGEFKTVGVYAHYTVIWPLMVNEQTVGNRGVAGLAGLRSGNTATQFISEAEMEIRRNDAQHHVVVPLRISARVGGLKYYPDLDL